MVAPTPAPQGGFAFQRALGDGDYVAAGHLQISAHKAPKNTKDNSYVRIVFPSRPQYLSDELQIFYVVEGAVTVRIHQTYHTVHEGGMFMVPRGEPRVPQPRNNQAHRSQGTCMA